MDLPAHTREPTGRGLKTRPNRTFGQVSQSVAKSTGPPRASGRAAPPDGPSPDTSIEVLPEYLLVKQLIAERFPLTFVTGGAGTGKSTFIRWLDQQYAGFSLVCAPTGIAALTISGKTIHSLCKFPPAWIVEDDIRFQPRSLAKLAKVLVIDEVSMVNANLLDAVNRHFQVNRESPEPFGGVSVVLVGDLFQLPPVVTASTRRLFAHEYSSPKFFSAHALHDSPFRTIELTKAFRQTDQHFVDLLANIREGIDLAETLDELNIQCSITSSPPEGSVWLCPRHVDIDRVNAERLARLPGPERTYASTTAGTFKESQLPVAHTISLKVGAQVVLTNNTPSWVNGSIGTVTSMSTDRIGVRLISTGKVVEVPRHTWEQYDYVVSPDANLIERVIVGMFTQIPVVLAWAMTIHRSQGLTLDRVHLDLGAGAFASGQTYVALSRCRSLLTLSMSRPLRPEDIQVDPESRAFYAEIRR
jgi:ATP-dependent DNA helicase PIF1